MVLNVYTCLSEEMHCASVAVEKMKLPSRSPTAVCLLRCNNIIPVFPSWNNAGVLAGQQRGGEAARAMIRRDWHRQEVAHYWCWYTVPGRDFTASDTFIVLCRGASSGFFKGVIFSKFPDFQFQRVFFCIVDFHCQFQIFFPRGAGVAYPDPPDVVWVYIILTHHIESGSLNN
jgi:hypothetical protein